MPEATVILAIGLMLCSVLLLLMYLQGNRNPLKTRLGEADKPPEESPQQADILRDESTVLPPALQRLLPPLARIGEHLAGTESDRQQLRTLLSMSGFRAADGLGLLMAAKYACGLLFVAVMLLVVLDAQQRSSMTGLAGGLIGLFVGTVLPEAWLKWRAAKRGGRLSRSLPDGLDLMVICAEAGLPIGRVLQVVSKELSLSAPELADELRYTFAELQILSDRAKALQNLADRCGVPEMEKMVSTLLQAERYGTPLSVALRTISDESRKTLILNLEELAGKLPAQMSMPLMLLVLPPIIAMMGAPAMIRLVRMLAGN
ncbi:type II secretion system F family protein [Pseudomonas sp. LJDD11]|uniref:type II secretion system F family protein n=1 Tax=Pseudomonas sp. LJDD11 TaxID=2931984 RepID=UPI00211C6EA5|nr:type II secretion system F family protein [Pseudomonas sp. LJDD11]MCQ9427201.1 type II secretion system F family protein [Pseudomonas sp. LJDD11]